MINNIDPDLSLTSFLNAVSAAVLVIDRNFIIVHSNKAAEELLDYREGELSGISSKEVCGFRFESGEFSNFCSLARRKDGKCIPIKVAVKVLQATSGKEYLVTTLTDSSCAEALVGELKEQQQLVALRIAIGEALVRTGTVSDLLQECAQIILEHLDAAFSANRDSSGPIELQWVKLAAITQRKQAEHAEQLILEMQQREDFMFTLTHDLKNPLIGANRVLEQIAKGEFGCVADEATSMLLRLRSSNDDLVNLVQDIIEVYRHEKEEHSIIPVKFNLGDLIGSVLKALEVHAPQYCVSIKSTLPDTPVFITADLTGIRRVVFNLLHNAIKFSSFSGTVDVSLKTGAEYAFVDIHNDGESIDFDERQFLFQRFWQGGGGRKIRGGSGLGLYLCHKIVTLHNGTITCCSNEGTGTTFSVRLPLS